MIDGLDYLYEKHLQEDADEPALTNGQKRMISRATRKMYCKTDIDCDDCPLHDTRYCTVAGMYLTDSDYWEAYKIMIENK